MKYTTKILFFLVLLAVGLGVYRDYGISVDEPRSRIDGMVTLKYVADRFAPSLLTGPAWNLPPLKEYFDRDYGVAFEGPAVALEVILGIKDKKDVFTFRHLLTFLVALAGIFAVQRMADRRFSDWRIGFVAVLFLVLTPRLFAESFYNSKDVVFMAVFAIAMNTMLWFVLKPSAKTAFLHALTSAVAIDVRVMAIILPAATVAIVVVRLLKRELPISVTRALAIYLAVACVLVPAMWPWLWSHPIGNFLQAFRNMSKFRWDHELLYLGRFIRGTHLPWHYIPVWMSITTPLLYLGLFLVGTFIALRQIASRGIALWQGDEELQDVVFLGLVVTPVGAVILLHSVVYDGWRHLYFIYPAFMLLAIRGWVFIWGNDLVWTIRKSLLAIVTVISIVYTTAWMWKAHPFQNVYFNILAGSEPRSRYELDYWGLSNRKALEYIVKNDQSDVICVRADSWTSLDRAFEMIDSRDRKRLRYVARDDVVVNDPGPRQCDDPRYIVTNYRLVKDPDDRKYAEDYDLFYQIRVDNEVILSVFGRKGM